MSFTPSSSHRFTRAATLTALGAVIVLGLAGPAVAQSPSGAPQGRVAGQAAAPASIHAAAAATTVRQPAAPPAARADHPTAQADHPSAPADHPSAPADHPTPSSQGKADHSAGNAGTSGVSTEPQPISNADANGGGANGQCPGGPYCSTRDGSPSANGNGGGSATGRPCAGCVGKADNKNPHGQLPDASDPNAGYECDTNHGIARGNPAHSPCTSTPPPPPPCVPTAANNFCGNPPPPGCVPTAANDFCGNPPPPGPCVSTPARPCSGTGDEDVPRSHRPEGSPRTAATGFDAAWTLSLAVLLIAAGSAGLVAGRRKVR
jgi:hypothetical protein